MPETPLKRWKPHSVLSCCRGSQVKLPVAFPDWIPCRCKAYVFRNWKTDMLGFPENDIIKAMREQSRLEAGEK